MNDSRSAWISSRGPATPTDQRNSAPRTALQHPKGLAHGFLVTRLDMEQEAELAR
jgi:hypothetical protein